MKKQGKKGFTLVELMIATTVFAIVMLISTYAFLRINKYFTKGINQARTQDTVRNIVSDISDQIQLSPDLVTSGFQPSPDNRPFLCIGSKKYIYKLNVVEDGSGNAMQSLELNSSNCEADGGATKNLLNKDNRILVFDIRPLVSTDTNLYKIILSIAYTSGGDNDLIDSSATKEDGSPDYYNWICKSGISGSEYCAISKISTTVMRRVNN
jgi:prepilin-type N-terminal cleavage/methylation domain-containing protein